VIDPSLPLSRLPPLNLICSELSALQLSVTFHPRAPLPPAFCRVDSSIPPYSARYPAFLHFLLHSAPIIPSSEVLIPPVPPPPIAPRTPRFLFLSSGQFSPLYVDLLVFAIPLFLKRLDLDPMRFQDFFSAERLFCLSSPSLFFLDQTL